MTADTRTRRALTGLAAAGVLVIAGCTTTVNPRTGRVSTHVSPPPCPIQVFTRNEDIERPYRPVGMVVVTSENEDDPALMDKLKTAACKLGADAITNVQKRSPSIDNTFLVPGSQPTVVCCLDRVWSAVAIKWTRDPGKTPQP